MCPWVMAQNLDANAERGQKPMSKVMSISGMVMVVASPATEKPCTR